MDISVTFDLENGERKVIRGGLYRFEVRICGIRVYGFRYDPGTGKILCPESTDRNGKTHKSASISQELEDNILSIINGTNKQEIQKEEEIDPILKKQMEEDQVRREEWVKNKNNRQRDKIQ